MARKSEQRRTTAKVFTATRQLLSLIQRLPLETQTIKTHSHRWRLVVTWYFFPVISRNAGRGHVTVCQFRLPVRRCQGEKGLAIVYEWREQKAGASLRRQQATAIRTPGSDNSEPNR